MRRPRARKVAGYTGDGQHRWSSPTVACLRQQRGIPTGHTTMRRIYQIGVLGPPDAHTEAMDWLQR